MTLYGPGGDPGPAFYSGPFRFGKFSLHANYEVAFVPRPKFPATPDAAGHRAEFEVMTEPRVVAVRTGPVAKLEATDDRGQSLLDPSTLDPEKIPLPPQGYGFVGLPQTLKVPMKRPDPESKRLKILRGVMPVEIGVPQKEPSLTIPLAGSVRKAFRDGDVKFTIDEYTPRPGRGATFLKVREDRRRARAGRPLAEAGRLGAFRRVHRLIDIVDAEGRSLTSGCGRFLVGRRVAVQLHVLPPPPGGRVFSAPTHIRVYMPKWVAWDVPFEFRDLPLP